MQTPESAVGELFRMVAQLVECRRPNDTEKAKAKLKASMSGDITKLSSETEEFQGIIETLTQKVQIVRERHDVSSLIRRMAEEAES